MTEQARKVATRTRNPPGGLQGRAGERLPPSAVAVPALPVAVLLALAWLPATVLAAEQDSPSYTSDIAPILARNCIACHSTGTTMGGLVLETFGGLERGGAHGRSIVPGNSAESRLYLMVAGKIEPRMPFSANPLGPAEVELLRRWIDAGAPGPNPGEASVQVAQGRLPRIEPAALSKPQIFSLAYHPDGRLLAAGRHGGVALTHAETGEPVAFLDGLADIARSVAFSPDGRLLAAGGGHAQQGGEVRIWQVSDHRPLLAIQGHGDTIQALAFSPDGKTLATASYDKEIKLWDAASGRELRTLRDHIGAVYALAFTPDGTLLLSGSADRSVKVWDPGTGERLYTLSDPTDGINSIAIHPSGTQVAAGGYDCTIRVWELGENGGKVVNVLIAHRLPILRIAYSPDGTKIVTTGADRTLKVFDAETLAELASPKRQSDWVMSLAYSPDGRHLAAGRFDGSLSIYDSEHYRDQLRIIKTARKSP